MRREQGRTPQKDRSYEKRAGKTHRLNTIEPRRGGIRL